MKAPVAYRRERLDRGIKVRSDDIFALAGWPEILYLAGPRVAAAGFLLVFPLLRNWTGDYWQTVFLVAVSMMLAAVSWAFLENVGLVSLGHSLFFGAGGYLTAIAVLDLGLPPLLAVLLGTVGAAAGCAVLLAPVLRLRGVYFSLVTFALPLLFARVIEATKVLGGTEGLAGIPGLGSLEVRQYLLVVGLLSATFGLQRLLDSDYGLVLHAIRDNDLSVRASGIPVGWWKFGAVLVGVLPAALAGAVLATHYHVVGMSAFALDYSVLPLTAAVLGGSGAMAGAAVGAALLVPFSELLRAFGTLRVVAYCAVLVLVLVSVPEGLFSVVRRRYHQFERWVPL
ncbi:MAG: branched-chain amino acid ABC transporter permease [Armatimonadota bacterium]|nr:branched-chain amino acid ABC transporter permease [Armatimonadota bacterium]MDR7388456.1 branched-chain amino acid ABC transporter permease [Armatimonadota bacterium]MDR7394869.1 branched-chain amino acid ABC transporter permease [Armatimonadota bacterium]MDR7396214.1 branched-chain amino acid ABC transporter permease [Armatimonadota bacterium]MDR7399572.1 branched-chain amino acid ABC transporter permease [Armatimonadota bacterium]